MKGLAKRAQVQAAKKSKKQKKADEIARHTIVWKLTHAQEELVEARWNANIDPRTWLDAGKVLSQQNLLALRDGQLVDDAIVMAYMKLITQRSHNYAKVSKWTGKADIFSHDLLLFPTYIEGPTPEQSHWLLFTVKPQSFLIESWDSIPWQNELRAEKLKLYLTFEFNWVRPNSPINGVPRQNNGVGCAVFVCGFAEALSRNVLPTFSAADIPTLRKIV
ncbi:SUMO1 sentrin specific peptidase 1 [Rhizophlyctis rosea]|uniref:SUMO1 sentrin specific peptidase 1 n=1 Tax=Rhizophlyctis rosea TaxID=64517 RepID=A0AAD5SCU3_9FUNG|nr:SUMO1 sentrin specific peptidase 1 [Rhizophlyctis rosea]